MHTASFDTYAHLYDVHFTLSPIGMAQRRIVHNRLLPLLNKNQAVLELNCGTGYDAFEIAKHVGSVLATDASPAMVAECEFKLRQQTSGHLGFKVMRVQEADGSLGASDFVFSNFGGLNCLSPSEMERFAHSCRQNMKPGSELFLVIMGRHCLWEKLYFLWKFDPARAFRRKKKEGTPAQIEELEVMTWYYSPNELRRLFAPGFKLKACGPVGLFVPPSYLNPFFENRRRLLKVLQGLDRIFCKFKWTADYADHFYIHLKK